MQISFLALSLLLFEYIYICNNSKLNNNYLTLVNYQLLII